MGYRLHLEAIPDYLQNYTPKEMRKIDLINGQSIVGEIVNETDEYIKLRFEGGHIILPREEIEANTLIDESRLGSDEISELMIRDAKRPFITHHEDLSLVTTWKETLRELQQAPKPQTGGLQNYMDQAQRAAGEQQQKIAEHQQLMEKYSG
ncbi:MAG: hypothetical protein Q8R76_09525 [Candidatus Omnitrophota bacterium]|nr:hypothetical protein [Candidatus Omnitrophota bacterium]